VETDRADELLGPAPAAADRVAAHLPRWWKTVGEPISFTILGEPASKANSRKPAIVGKADAKRTIWIKSDKARDYERNALRQIPPAFRLRLQGPVFVTMMIWYANERSDLDESLVLDVMQDRYSRDAGDSRQLVQAGVYRNDRQVREKWIKHGVDVRNPRAEITVQPMVAQQAPLF
jgi:hypothetical protein